MRSAIHLTKAVIEGLEPKAKQYEVKDMKTPGLFVRVNPAGSKSYIFCRKKSGRNLKVTIGRVNDISIENARKQADLIRSQIITGEILHRSSQRQSQDITFATLYERYYNEHALQHTKRPEDNKKQLNNHIIPKIGRDKVSLITRDRMKEIHLNIGSSSGRTQANRMLNMASAVFNYGIQEQIYKGINPCNGIKRFKRRSRDRFLTQEELESFFKALDLEQVLFRDFFLLTLFIGARKSTMLAMKYADLNFELKRWRVSEAESKNDEVNIFMLADCAMEILTRRYNENRSSECPSLFVFPGDGHTGHLADPKKAFARIKRRMDVSDITIHDLRRTLGSYMAMDNTSLPIIGKALNHKSQVSTEIYARLSNDPVLKAVNSATELMKRPAPKKDTWQIHTYNLVSVTVANRT